MTRFPTKTQHSETSPYGHLVITATFLSRKNANNFLTRKPRHPVDTANGQILQSQLVQYFTAVTRAFRQSL